MTGTRGTYLQFLETSLCQKLETPEFVKKTKVMAASVNLGLLGP